MLCHRALRASCASALHSWRRNVASVVASQERKGAKAATHVSKPQTVRRVTADFVDIITAADVPPPEPRSERSSRAAQRRAKRVASRRRQDGALVQELLESTAPAVRQCYSALLSHTCINPFNGRLLNEDSRQYKMLARIGFRRGTANPMHLVWHADVFMHECAVLLRRYRAKTQEQQQSLSSSESMTGAVPPTGDSEVAVKGTCPELAVTMTRVMKTLLHPFESSNAAPWQRQVAQLLRRPDALAVVATELQRRYDELVSAYMPAKLDAAPDGDVADDMLTADQANVVQLALRGYHLYLGGSAGTGKTVLLKAIYHRLRQLGLHVAMTATTGVAAVQLGGCTFHHAFNVPVELASCGLPRKRWDHNALRAVDVVIVDEVSLLDAHLLDVFDMEARLARMQDCPFGGIQLIACGDFLQLSNSSVVDALPAYQSDSFRQLVHLKLVTPMRQREDDPLFCLLTRLREGHFDAAAFRALDRPLTAGEDDVTYIFPRRREAQALNDARLSELQTPELLCAPQRGPLYLRGSFTASAFIELGGDAGGAKSVQHAFSPSFSKMTELLWPMVCEAMRQVCPDVDAPAEHDCVCMPTRTSHSAVVLRLRQPERGGSGEAWGRRGGSQLTHAQWERVARHVANQVGGRVVSMCPAAEEPLALVPQSVTNVLMDGSAETDVAERNTVPLRLKLGCRVMVNRNLSRTVSNGSVGIVEAFAAPDTRLFPRRREFAMRGVFKEILVNRLFAQLPVVRLLSGEVIQVPPVPITLGGGPQTYYYAQDLYVFPLQLGYAFTVHKVQGLTLPGTVILDCKNFFDCPHLIYVACSRVRSIDQLIVRNIEPDMVIIKRSAVRFSAGLPEARDPRVLNPSPEMPRAAWVRRVAPRGLSVD